MKIAFMGTPRFAAVVLEKLIKSKHKVVCVVTQPDAEAGRNRAVKISPVKQFAAAKNIPVLQPLKISGDTAELAKFRPDIIVTCAFGQILRQSVLDLAPFGVINVHGSLLPKYRGAAPIQWAVINGEKETGITIARTELGLDCGPIIEQVKTAIGETETGGELFERLSVIGAEALVAALDKIEGGAAKFIPQDESKATTAPILSKEMGHIDWTGSAKDIVNLVRGLNPWPVAYFLLDGKPVRVYKATALSGYHDNIKYNMLGSVVLASAKQGLLVQCGDGVISVDELQIPGKKIMTAKEFLNGKAIKEGTILC
jgi:methionyl-tRNA formyltransferase